MFGDKQPRRMNCTQFLVCVRPSKHWSANFVSIQILCDRRYLLKALGFGLNTIGLSSDISPMRFSNGGRQMVVMPLRPTGEATLAGTPPSPAAQTSTITTTSTTDETQPHPAVKTTAATTSSTPPSKDKPKSALESALVQIESLKTAFRESINGLTKLGDALRQVIREQKASEKEVQTVRQTLRSLQGVRL